MAAEVAGGSLFGGKIGAGIGMPYGLFGASLEGGIEHLSLVAGAGTTIVGGKPAWGLGGRVYVLDGTHRFRPHLTGIYGTAAYYDIHIGSGTNAVHDKGTASGFGLYGGVDLGLGREGDLALTLGFGYLWPRSPNQAVVDAYRDIKGEEPELGGRLKLLAGLGYRLGGRRISEVGSRTWQVSDGSANRDRGFLAPTALMQPAGTLTYSNYDLVGQGLTYGIADYLQVGACALIAPPIAGASGEGMALASGKVRLLATRFLHLAAQVGAGKLSWSSYREEWNPSIAFAGAIGTFCVDEECGWSFSGSGSAYQVLDRNRQLFLLSATAMARLTKWLSIVAELINTREHEASSAVDSTGATRPGEGWDDVAILGGLVRLSFGDVAIDLGAAFPIAGKKIEFPFPLLSFSYRMR